MNWVGGARSRVRQHAEKKIQKDFFERRRLAGKVQRIRPALSKVKTAVSQDLLFLKVTASATESRPLSPGHTTHMPKPLSLERGGKDRLSMRPQRDMELPMSPIDRASSLDLMDTTTNATFLSEILADQGVSGDGRGLREPPRVSTQKIPHQTILDSFGPPRMNDFELECRHVPSGEDCEHRTVPSEDNHLLNISTMTESLFPQPAKRRKEHSKGTGRSHGAKKYALDDMLKQNQPLPELNARHKLAPEGAPVFHAQQHGKHRTGDQTQSKHSSIFTIAKGGWWDAETQRGPRREKEGNASRPVGYQFDFERHNRGHAPGVEVAAMRDCDAMLELHYDTEKTRGRKFDTKPGITHDRDPDPDQVIPTFAVSGTKDPGWKGKSKLDESCQQDPWLSSTKSVSSVLSEDPFSGRKIPHVFAGPPVFTSMDFDESVFGPLRRRGASGGHPLRQGVNTLAHGDTSMGHHREKPGHLLMDRASSLDTTQYNESILAPIRNAKKGISHEEMTQQYCDESILAPVRARKRSFHKLPEPGTDDRSMSAPIHAARNEGSLRFGESTPARIHAARNEGSLDPVRFGESTPVPIHAARNEGSLDPVRFSESTPARIHAARNEGSLDPVRFGESTPARIHAARNEGSLDPVRFGESTPARIHAATNEGSLDPVRFGESTPVPIRATGKVLNNISQQVPLALGVQAAMGILTPARNTREEVSDRSVAGSDGGGALVEGVVAVGRKSAFETMMASLEKSSVEKGREKVAEVIRGSPTFNSKGSRVQLEVYHTSDRDKLPPSYLSYECDDNASLPDSGQVSALPRYTASNGLEQNPKYKASNKPGNISVLHELMSLEEEIASHYEDGLLSQCSTEEMGENSEDPLFQRACGKDQGYKSRCSFASSQESATLEINKTSYAKQTNFNNDGQGDASTETRDSFSAAYRGSPVVVVVDGELCTVSSDKSEPNGALKSASSNENCGNKAASMDIQTLHTLVGSIETSSVENDSTASVNVAASTTGTDGSQILVPCSSIQEPELDNRASTGVQTDREFVCSSTQTSGSLENDSNAKPELEASDNEVTKGVQEFVCSSTQTSDSLKDKDEVCAKLSKNESEASDDRCIATKGVQTDKESSLCSLEGGSGAKSESPTNDNLTIGLEKHRMVPRKKEVGQYCNVACQTSKEETLSEAGCDQGMNSAVCGPSKSKEAERLRQRVMELEEKVLFAESTLVWQSVMIKCLKLDSERP